MSVSDKGADLLISGQVEEGAYMGPEVVRLCDRNGRRVHSMVTQHAIESPRDWPLVPGDGSTLILSVAKPSSGFALDSSQLVAGQGTITINSNRLDVTDMLDDPAFWAIWMPLHFDCEDVPEPSLAWGLTSEEADAEYADRFQSSWNAGVWPFVRLRIDDSLRYVEIEYASGVEHQNRVWIGVDGGQRVLLGYDSGHFSFPAMRIQELLNLAERMGSHVSAPLLLLGGAYLVEGDVFPTEAVTRWLLRSPGFHGRYVDAMVAELARNVVSELTWEFTERSGWINNWRYSQRNPGSAMSILSPEDFRFILDFFG
ncbi:MAG: hypothetical protein U0Q16_21715 [Bryobacteraceae bacterium]